MLLDGFYRYGKEEGEGAKEDLSLYSAAFESDGSWKNRKRRKAYIKCRHSHSCINLVRPRFLDILRILGPALLEIMVETYLAYDIQSVGVIALVTLWGHDFILSTYVALAVHFITFVYNSPPLLTIASSSEERSLAADSNTDGAMPRTFAALSK